MPQFYNSHTKEIGEGRLKSQPVLLHHKNLLIFLLTYKGPANLKFKDLVLTFLHYRF